MNRFSIIIVSWNAQPLLETFLPSVVNAKYENFEVILADNNSSDNSIEWIQSKFPSVKIVRHDDNYGYAGGNNKAVEVANGDFLIFLNNDVEVQPDWLEELDVFLSNYPQFDVVQPKLLSYKERGKFEYAGAAGGYIDQYGYPFCRGRIFDNVEVDSGQYDSLKQIFWASGAAFCIRKSVFEELHGFDEVFEFHLEEIDLCWRAWSKGHQIGYCPNSVVFHLGGGSLPVQSPRKVFYNFRNSLLMLYKNLERNIFSKIFLRLVLDGIAGLKFLLEGSPSLTLAVVKAHFSFYNIILNRKSELIFPSQLHKTKLPDGIILKKSLIWSFFVRGKSTFALLWPENK